jgi:hypothetical protein
MFLLAVLAMAVLSSSAQASGGFYGWGFTVGRYDQLEEGVFQDDNGGWTLGFQRGMYFIKDLFALSMEYGIDAGLGGEDFDRWLVEVPNGGIRAGTGVGAFMVYAGGQIAPLGLDGLSDGVHVSLLNPRGLGGIQVGGGGFIFRAEFHVGRMLRIGDDDFNFFNVALTFGYGLYSEII